MDLRETVGAEGGGEGAVEASDEGSSELDGGYAIIRGYVGVGGCGGMVANSCSDAMREFRNSMSTAIVAPLVG